MLDYNEFYLTLVRHGQSTTNENPDLMGQEGTTPLSDNGRRQAHLLRDRLAPELKGIDHIYSSHYTRALDTAMIATNRTSPAGITIAEDLREYSAGDWTHASRKDTITLPVQARMGLLAHGFLPPNGESLHQVERRASRWVEDTILYNKGYIEAAARNRKAGKPPTNIYCFSHGMTIKCLLHYVMGFDQSFTWKVTIENTSLSKLYFGKDGWRLLSINDCAHLL
jgi:broad specificity phosphatase PhoE